MIVAQDFKKAQFSYKGSDGAPQTLRVDFNPSTLDYSVTINTQGEGGQTQQAAGVASAKLNLELLFDTTDSGDDVRTKTNKVELMLQPAAGTGGPNAPKMAPPMVTFEWGAFKFVGVVDSFKQVMDFFSANGVPLRAAVTLSMSQPNYQFDQKGATDPRTGNPISANVDQTVELPGGSPFQLATDAGDPGASRDIAFANGLESLRASAGAGIAVGGGVSIGAAAGFSAAASGSAGIGISFGAGGGIGGAAGAGLSASFGGGASAGVSATAGAFAGLHGGAGMSGGKYLEPQKLLAAGSAPGIAPGALFDVTGRAVAQSASTFKAEVGASSGLRFDDN